MSKFTIVLCVVLTALTANTLGARKKGDSASGWRPAKNAYTWVSTEIQNLTDTINDEFRDADGKMGKTMQRYGERIDHEYVEIISGVLKTDPILKEYEIRRKPECNEMYENFKSLVQEPPEAIENCARQLKSVAEDYRRATQNAAELAINEMNEKKGKLDACVAEKSDDWISGIEALRCMADLELGSSIARPSIESDVYLSNKYLQEIVANLDADFTSCLRANGYDKITKQLIKFLEDADKCLY